MKHTRIVAAVAAAATIAALTGCSASSSAEGSGGSIKGATLTYWATNQGTSLEDDKRILTPVLDAFTKETGAKVDLEVIDTNSLQNRLQTAITSGTGPDVTGIGNSWAPAMQATGAFLPFGKKEMTAIGGEDKFISTAMEATGAEGQTPTSVPFLAYSYGLYYNKAKFAAAGLQSPTTWEELVSAAKTFTDPSKGEYGMSIMGGSFNINAQIASILAAQNGASLATKDGKPDLDNPKVVAAVKRFVDLMQTDKVVDTANAEYNANMSQMNGDFAKGKAAMVLSMSNANESLAAEGMKPDQYGVVPLPAPSGGKAVSTYVSGINLSVLKSSKHQAAALALVKYLTSKGVQEKLDKEYVTLPVLQGQKADFLDDQATADAFLKIYSQQAVTLPRTAWEATYETTVGKAMNSMFATVATGGTVSEKDVQAALKQAQATVEQVQ